MKALVYHGPGKMALQNQPMPKITAATDALVKIRKTTICGTDLHILKGDVPTCKPGSRRSRDRLLHIRLRRM
jgi:alcohol dehydrogenase